MPLERSNFDEMMDAMDLMASEMAEEFELLIREQTILHQFGFVPMNCIPQESAEQFDRLTKFGIKLNLITGEYK